MTESGIKVLDSITDADTDTVAQVVVCGSHGGRYAAYCASQSQLRAVILNDAGVGLDAAGIEGVMALADTGMAAACTGHLTCCIGQAADALQRGRISAVNSVADSLGLRPGMTCRQAARLLLQAQLPHSQLPAVAESRADVYLDNNPALPAVLAVDSASLVLSEDTGRVIVTGSHGGLVGSGAARALKADALVAVFNDAGTGIDAAGVSRLPALDLRGVAAVTVAHSSARIGDARSMLEGGVLSHCNQRAVAVGARPGLALRQWLLDYLQKL